MRAIKVTRPGDPDVLEITNAVNPSPGPNEVVVDVSAIGVNFNDTKQRKVSRPPGVAGAFIPGSEGAGTVTAVGSDVSDVSTGDAVAFWQPGCGAYAEQVVVTSSRTVPIPPDLDPTVAAALYVQGLTAHYLSTSVISVHAGHVAVVHTGAGGVGLLLTQMIKSRGAMVVATSSSTEKWQLMTENGADRTSDYEQFVDAVMEISGGVGADVVFDAVGDVTFDRGLEALRRRGLMVLYGSSSGPVPPVDLLRLYAAGSLFVTHPTLGDYIASRSELLARWHELLDDVANGRLNVRIGGTYPLESASQAHWDLESRRTTGKLLLLP